jgi:transposase InsO family protein
VNEVWHLDTFFLPKDDGSATFQAYLICVDALSRFVRVRKMDSVRSSAAKKALAAMIRDSKCRPVIIISDDGSEFKGEFQKFLQSLNIRSNIARGASKAFFAERYVKEIKARLYRRSTFLGEKIYNDAVNQTKKYQ